MKAMILAAGRGERLRPLTDSTPKPLLVVGQHRLIEWHLLSLARAGIQDVVINVSWLADQIQAALGDGKAYGVNITYSIEPEQALETGGGIFQAMEHLQGEAFLVINGDIWTDFPFSQKKLPEKQAHLIMVSNPEHHADGDFSLDQALLRNDGDGARLTYSGIGLYRPEFFSGCHAGRFPLAPLLIKAMQVQQVTGEKYEGCWIDVGTPERLQAARDLAQKR